MGACANGWNTKRNETDRHVTDDALVEEGTDSKTGNQKGLGGGKVADRRCTAGHAILVAAAAAAGHVK